MADDIGPGDVVERLPPGGPHFAAGTRCLVVGICREPHQPCDVCAGAPGLLIEGGPQGNREMCDCECPCGWRKIGGSREDTIRRFAEDLTAKPPARVLEPAGADARVEGRHGQ